MFRLQLILDAGINDAVAINYNEEGHIVYTMVPASSILPPSPSSFRELLDRTIRPARN